MKKNAQVLTSLEGEGHPLLEVSSEIPKEPEIVTYRRVFSLWVKLVGHFPAYGCPPPHIAIIFIKCRATVVTSGRDDKVTDILLPWKYNDGCCH